MRQLRKDSTFVEYKKNLEGEPPGAHSGPSKYLDNEEKELHCSNVSHWMNWLCSHSKASTCSGTHVILSN